jgi:hypothetical protein
MLGLLVATLLVVVPSLLGLVRSVTLYNLTIFVIKNLSFSVDVLFYCLSAFEYHLGCFYNIWVL